MLLLTLAGLRNHATAISKAMVWLEQHEQKLARVKSGFVDALSGWVTIPSWGIGDEQVHENGVPGGGWRRFVPSRLAGWAQRPTLAMADVGGDGDGSVRGAWQRWWGAGAGEGAAGGEGAELVPVADFVSGTLSGGTFEAGKPVRLRIRVDEASCRSITGLPSQLSLQPLKLWLTRRAAADLDSSQPAGTWTALHCRTVEPAHVQESATVIELPALDEHGRYTLSLWAGKAWAMSAPKPDAQARPSSNSTQFPGTCWSLPWAFCGIGYGC